MSTFTRFTAFVVAACCVGTLNCGVAQDSYTVNLLGEVEFNQINNGILGDANPGDSMFVVFEVDESNFVDSPNFATRGYPLTNFFMQIDGVGAPIGLQDPFPISQTPYFVIRDDDPGVDGFFVSTNFDFPVGVPLDQNGQFTQFTLDFSVTYTGETLPSLDVVDATGTFDFEGLTVFNWSINDGPFNAMGLIFTVMEISKSAPCEPDCNFSLGDVNNDGNVDLLDVSDFVQAVVTNNYICEADTNSDFAVDLLDVQSFVALILNGN